VIIDMAAALFRSSSAITTKKTLIIPVRHVIDRHSEMEETAGDKLAAAAVEGGPAEDGAPSPIRFWEMLCTVLGTSE